MDRLFQYFDFWDLIWGCGVYVGLICLLATSPIMNRILLRDRRGMLLYILLSFFVFIFSLLNVVFEVLPVFPDSLLYSELYVNGSNGIYLSFSKEIYLFFLNLLSIPLLGSLTGLIAVQWVCYILSYMLLARAWASYSADAESAKVSFLLYMLYPAALMFVGMPMRESFFLLGFSIFIYGLVGFIGNGSGLKFIFLGIVIAVLMRAQFLIILVSYFYLSIFFMKNKWRNILVFSIVPIASINIFLQLTGYSLTPEWLSYIRQDAADRYAVSGFVYGDFDWHSYFDVLLDVPSLTAQFVFSPFPILHSIGLLRFGAYALDLIFVVIVLILSLKSLMQTANRYWLFLIMLGFVVLGFWEFYIGGAVRHRMPIVLLMLFPASFEINKYIKRLVLNEK